MSKKLERLAAKLGSAGYAVYSDGGKIHIKPSHRGRLTELKERTGKSEEELYNDGNPAHKKMVVFARNARQWRHDTGGPLGVGGAAWLNPLQYAKWLAYKIGTDDMVSSAGSASPIDIVSALAKPDSEVERDDNKWAYLFGTGDRYPVVQEPIRGFNYDNYLKDSGYARRGVDNVYGVINPDSKYSVSPQNQPLLTELAEHGWHMYDNADSGIFEPAGQRYRDDVGSFIHKFELTPSGQVMVHDSDIYDFKPKDYSEVYNKSHPSWLSYAEAWLMDKIGQPYIIRQENQPVVFEPHKYGPGSNIDKRLENMTGDEVAKITETGSIQPAVVYDRAKGGPINKYDGTTMPTQQMNTGVNDDYRDQLVYWATYNPGALWGNNPEAYKARQWLETNYPEDFASLYWAEDDKVRSGIDQKMIPVKARERRMEDAVRERDKAAPYVAGALAAPVVLGEAIGVLPHLGTWADLLAASRIGRGIGHTLNVLGNPLAAKTGAGAFASLGLDVAGLGATAYGLSDKFNKAVSGTYTASDIPATLLDLSGAIPGASATTRILPGAASNLFSTARAAVNAPFSIGAEDLSSALSPVLSEAGSTNISKAFRDKVRYQSIIDRLTKYRANSKYNTLFDETKYPNYYYKPSRSTDMVINTIENDLDDIALHGGFKYDTKYDTKNFLSFFDAAEDAGYDTDRLLSQYESFADALTNSGGTYLPSSYQPSVLLDKIRNGSDSGIFIDSIKIGNAVNEDGSINNDAVAKIYRAVRRRLMGSGYTPKSVTEKYGSTNGVTNLKEHIKGVVKTAQEIPVPKGSSRQELVRAALVHDIGKLVTGQETATSLAEHSLWGERLLRTFPELAEFSSPTLRSSVLLHMDDEVSPIFGSHGMGVLDKNSAFKKALGREGDALPDYDINWDLVHALQASDVARGLSYDEAALKYPQLFMYDREFPAKINWGFSGDKEGEWKHIVRPIFQRQGYPVPHTEDELMATLDRHNSFFRGVRDPLIPGQTVSEQATLSGTSADERLSSALSSVSPVPSSSGRADLFYGKILPSGKPAYGPTNISKRLKVSPTEQDAIFVSVSPETATTFATPNQGHYRPTQVGRVQFPTSKQEAGESLASLIEKNDFQLLSASEIGSGKPPMGRWQMFEQPYRLQTGRSLSSDMAEAYSGQRTYREPKVISVSTGPVYQQIHDLRQNIRRMSARYPDIASRLGSLFKKSFLGEVVPGSVATLSGKIGRKFKEFTKSVAAPIQGVDYVLSGSADVDDIFLLYSRLGLPSPSKRALQGYRSIGKKFDKKIFTMTPADVGTGKVAVVDEDRKRALGDYAAKYIITPKVVHKIRDNYFSFLGTGKRLPTSEFLSYMKDDEAAIKFMRERGIVPVWDMPSFGKHVVVGNGGHRGTWTSSPKTRNKSLDSSAAQGYIVGRPGEKLLDINMLYPNGSEGLKPVLDKRFISRFRDDGRRYQGELPEYAVTRKTYETGGPLGSEEGDIPAAVVTPRPENVALYTYGVSGNYPITHSRLVGNGLLIDKGRVDPSYNLLKANCADATGDIIGGWNNIDLTYGLTTPKSIQNATRSIYGNTPEYRERRMPGVTIQSFQVPWYDLRTARDAANQMEFDRVTAGMSPEEIEEVRRSYNRDLPKLPYYIDQNGNVIPVQQSYTRGGMLRVLATGGQTYGIDDRSRSGDRYYDVVKARYEGVMDALKRRGFGYNDAARVAPMIIMQNNLEGGWTVNRKDNNFGGMKAGNKVISYDSVGDFYDAYLDMLDSKWGGDKDSPDNWRNAKDIKDWARILNHEDLGLDTEEKFKAYNRTHRDNPVYLYAPEWDNGGKKYGETLGGVQNRTLAYLDMVTADSPYENWTAAAVREKLSGLPKIQSTLSSNPGLVKALLEARTGPHNYIEWKASKGM